MDRIKKHYEKVLLGFILVGATAAVASLLFWIPSEKARLEEERNQIISRQPKPLTNLDLTLGAAAMTNLSAAPDADFGRPHHLLNPVQWQKTAPPEGKLIKVQTGNEVGIDATVITKTTPLYLILTLDSVGPSISGAPSGYLLGLERQAGPAGKRSKRQLFAKLNEKKDDTLTLREVKGSPENPDEVVVEMSDTGERVSLTKERPYRRVEGYVADLKNEPAKGTYINKRVGDRLVVGGEEYNIVAITENEVVFSHKLTGKKASIRKKSDDTQS
jgi:hypothetical protein